MTRSLWMRGSLRTSNSASTFAKHFLSFQPTAARLQCGKKLRALGENVSFIASPSPTTSGTVSNYPAHRTSLDAQWMTPKRAPVMASGESKLLHIENDDEICLERESVSNGAIYWRPQNPWVKKPSRVELIITNFQHEWSICSHFESYILEWKNPSRVELLTFNMIDQCVVILNLKDEQMGGLRKILPSFQLFLPGLVLRWWIQVG